MLVMLIMLVDELVVRNGSVIRVSDDSKRCQFGIAILSKLAAGPFRRRMLRRVKERLIFSDGQFGKYAAQEGPLRTI